MDLCITYLLHFLRVMPCVLACCLLRILYIHVIHHS